tara:strand:- start:416 stop:2842 length:2427 start_codon:yes stop_codon:yes gene_type:complete
MSLLPKNAGILEFKILDHLGSGGFANTYLARDENLDKQVAIKEFFPRNICERGDDFNVRPQAGHEATFQTYLTHFLAEAQILARFDEPNVVKVLRYFEGLGTAYIIMEFVEGRHLDDYIQETDFITEETVTDWLDGILTGLNAIHANDIIHGDIKPKNIIINSENQPVLIDFGASVIYQAKKDDGELYDEVFVSPNYAAPEQLSGAATIDHRVDIFALGAVFFEVITREKFRTAETSSAADILNYGKFYDSKILRSIETALRDEPNERFESCEEWLFYVTLSKGQKFGRFLKRRKWAIAAAAACLASIGYFGFYLVENEVDEKNYRYKLFASQTEVTQKLDEGEALLAKMDGAIGYLNGFANTIDVYANQIEARHLVTGRTSKQNLAASAAEFRNRAAELETIKAEMAELRRRYYFDDYPAALSRADKITGGLDKEFAEATRYVFASVVESQVSRQSEERRIKVNDADFSSLINTVLQSTAALDAAEISARAAPVVRAFLDDQLAKNNAKAFAQFRERAATEISGVYQAYKGRKRSNNLRTISDKIKSAKSVQQIELLRREAKAVVQRIEKDRQTALATQQRLRRENAARAFVQRMEAQMLHIPGGAYMMGGNDHMYARPVHPVQLQPFWIGKTEVTVGEWQRCVEDKKCPATKSSGSKSHPVTGINWNDAQAFIAWLNSKSRVLKFRLPSEAEWEYVVKKYGFKVQELQGGLDRTTVDQKNQKGINSILGNALEWLDDCWHGGYRNAPNDGSSWNTGLECDKRVVRGSSWEGEYTLTEQNASYFRPYGIDKTTTRPTLGFRLAGDRR